MQSRNRPYALDPRRYLERRPERLALQGYRGWTWTIASRSAGPWLEVCQLYRVDLETYADAALETLSDFVETLGLCAACPLKMRQAGSCHICRDEALVLALISAIQHSDDDVIERSIASICCPALADRVRHAAGVYALTLKMLDRILLPIPAQALASICRPPAGNDHVTVH